MSQALGDIVIAKDMHICIINVTMWRLYTLHNIKRKEKNIENIT